MVQLATKTLAAIDAALEADGGAKFRGLLKEEIAKLTDAFSTKEESFRGHLGASSIGRPCSRELWYTFHWAKKPTFKGAVLRLFNRGHLEEARFSALLRLIGCEIWTHSPDGIQLRIHATSRHYGGSLDGIAVGVPDVAESLPVLVEYKTHNNKSFSNLLSEGVERAKWEHYVQMCCYGDSHNLTHALYLAVNKDNDQLYGEIVAIDRSVAQQHAKRAQEIIDCQEPPLKVNPSPGWYQCKFCDHYNMCHNFVYPEVNCRTCAHSTPTEDRGWVCELKNEPLTIPAQKAACERHIFNPSMLNGIQILQADGTSMTYLRADGVTVRAGGTGMSSKALKG